MVAVPFDVAGQDHDLLGPVETALVLGCELNETVEDPVVEVVDPVIEVGKLSGELEIAGRERPDRLLPDHARVLTHLHQLVTQRRIVAELGGTLHHACDRRRVVTHAFEVDVDVEDRRDETQVARDRGLERDRSQGTLLDLLVEVIDLPVAADDSPGPVRIALGERPDRVRQHLVGDLGHLDELLLEVVELVVEVGAHVDGGPPGRAEDNPKTRRFGRAQAAAG